jgi:hypothetical protein
MESNFGHGSFAMQLPELPFMKKVRFSVKSSGRALEEYNSNFSRQMTPEPLGHRDVQRETMYNHRRYYL